MTEVTATFMTLVAQDSNIEVGPSIRSAIYAITTAMSRAWLEGREVSLNDLKREIISNMVNVVRGNFANETEKKDYLARKFDEAVMMYRRYSRR
ncbi:hypothetical protein [Vulcanisaeta distributa]|uniref:hypothetical protein n=1 Tax=Vulcanisaeta distributa TaxID=164451 RepID=UPI000A46D2C4|nr:hypothetical protein [Vulcanisaeta distributa]